MSSNIERNRKQNTRLRTHNPWTVAICVALILFSVQGIIANTISLFMTQVSEELPDTANIAQLAFYYTFLTGTMAICQPLARKLFAKYDARLSIGFSVILACVGFFLISFYTSYIGWLISAVIIGLGFSFIVYLMGPILIGNWFKKNHGLILGIVLAFSNIGGAVFSAIVGNLISSLGWMNAIRVSSLIAFVIGILATFIGLKYAPDTRKGERRYGEEISEASTNINANTLIKTEGYTLAQSIRTPLFWMIAIAVIVCFFGANFQTQASKFATTAYNFSIAQAGYLSTVLMIGAILGKVILGAINDRFGCSMSYLLGCGCLILGILVLVIGVNISAFVGFFGALLFGFGFSSISVLPPFLVRQVLGEKYFVTIFSYVASIGTIVSMFASNVFATIYEQTGSYTPGMIAASICLILGIILVFVANKMSPYSK